MKKIANKQKTFFFIKFSIRYIFYNGTFYRELQKPIIKSMKTLKISII